MFLTAFLSMKQQLRILLAVFAYQHEAVAFHVGAVFEIAGFAGAVRAFADGFGFVTEIYGHAVVKHAQATFPESVVAVLFPVFHDTAVYLVDLFKPALFHHGTDHFAADATGAVRDDFFVFDIVVFVAFEFFYEITRSLRVWHYGVTELPYLGFVLVAAVKKHYVIAVFFYHFVYFARFEVLAAADYAAHIHIKLVFAVLEPDQLAPMFYAHAREILARACRPFPDDVFERRIAFGGFHISFEIVDIAANRTVQPVFAHQYTSAQIERVAEGFLPQFHRFRVGKRREFIVQQYLLHICLLYLYKAKLKTHTARHRQHSTL